MKSIAWKRICCPVDFSPESRAALAVAVDLCRRLGAELTLLHVADDPAAPARGEHEAWREEAEATGVPVTVAATTGDPKSAIAGWADREGVDAVVMGTHGRTGRARALVGSVAENTVRTARCPVMVVHSEWPGLA